MTKKEIPVQLKAADPEKKLKLVLNMFLAGMAFLFALVLLFFFMKLVFGVLRYMSWLDYVFAVFMVCVPAVLFVTAFSIFFRRTLMYPVKPVRLISLAILGPAIVGWVVLFIRDIIHFFQSHKIDIGHYWSYEKTWLVSSVALIFILGVVQALSLPREPDWMEKAAQKDLHID